jgi:hypothetical protein
MKTIEQRISSLESKAGNHTPRCDLFARIKRYEEIYEAMDAGLLLMPTTPMFKHA